MTAGDLGRTEQAEDQAHRAEPKTEMGSIGSAQGWGKTFACGGML